MEIFLFQAPGLSIVFCFSICIDILVRIGVPIKLLTLIVLLNLCSAPYLLYLPSMPGVQQNQQLSFLLHSPP